MLALRVFVAGDVVKVWLYDDSGEPLRELMKPIGHVGGDVDWAKALGEAHVLPGEEGIQIPLVTE